MDIDERLMTVAEVAEVLRVSTMTVYRLIQRDELAAIRVGRSFRIRPGALDDYLSTGGSSDATRTSG